MTKKKQKMAKDLMNFPEEILKTIQPFLSPDDWHFLMNACKQRFSGLKKQTIYFSLTKRKSMEYATEFTFRHLLLNKVTNGWKQIALNFTDNYPPFSVDIPAHAVRTIGFCIASEDFQSFAQIACINKVRDMQAFPPILMIKELSVLNGFNLRSLKNLEGLSSLTLFGLRRKDISPLRTIKHLSIHQAPFVADFSCLSGRSQSSLQLSHCPGLVNVSSFSLIRDLILSDCINLVDVSSLRGIFSLQIICCPLVKDISGLGSHHRLHVAGCSEDLIGFDSLFAIPHVILEGCQQFTDTAVLHLAKTVELHCCSSVSSVSALRGARRVTIRSDSFYVPDSSRASEKATVTDIDSLAAIPDLSLSFDAKSPYPVNIMLLKNKRLSLTNCPCPDSITERVGLFRAVEFLHLSHCDAMIEQLLNRELGRCFSQLKELVINGSKALSHVNDLGLGDIPTLKLIFCDNLRDVNGLGGKNRFVEIIHCRELVDVSALREVPIVTIRGCPKIKDISCLACVPRLKILSV